MKAHEKGILNSIGKSLASPLSRLVANSATEGLARIVDAYWSVLLGKGAGAGWALATEIEAAKSSIKSNTPILFDVGANSGEWAAEMVRNFPDAKLYLFEPQPRCQQILRERKIANAVLVPKAVGHKEEHALLHTTAEITGIASFHERRDSYFQDQTFKSIEVEITTIDEVISTYGIETVDFMKMDIEGHELEALKGAQKNLAKHTIRALSFEFGSGNVNSRTFFHDFWDLLQPLGYDIYRILPSSRLMKISEYYEDCEYFRGVTNYIAITR